MKQTINIIYGRLFAVIMLITTSVSTFAADGDTFVAKTIEGEDMTFMVISEEEKTCQVGDGRACAINQTFNGEISIPNSIYGYSVIAIGRWAFISCKINSITIPNSVLIIGEMSFYHCLGLTEFIIPNSVTDIENEAFDGCVNLTNVTIGSSVVTIGDMAFNGCKSLANVDIPNSVTDIGSRAFAGCNSLDSVYISESVTFIEPSAFARCIALSSITVDVNNDVYDSRYMCNGIIETSTNTLIVGCQKTIIPKSVTTIGKSAFSGCTGLTYITMPNTVTTIDDAAFEDCTNLTDVVIPYSVITIGNDAFNNCTSLTNVNIPNSVSCIGKYAFASCVGLTTINIPSSVTKIGYEAFMWCGNLTSVHITDIAAWCRISFGGERANPLRIAHRLFLNDEEVEELIIPDYLTSISENAFQHCSSLTKVNIPNSVITIGSSAFQYCENLIEVNLPNSVVSIGSFAFSGCKGLIDLVIPNSVTTIEKNTFSGCTALVNLSLPNSLTNIKEYAFANCVSLKKINLPNTVTDIGSAAFKGCSSLIDIIIPNSVTNISDRVFQDCTSLTYISIPSFLSAIGESTFAGCGALTNIVSYSRAPFTMNNNVFTTETFNSATLSVPFGTKNIYVSTEGWNNFTNIIEREDIIEEGSEFIVKNEDGVELFLVVVNALEKTLQLGGKENRAVKNTIRGELNIPDKINGFSIIRIGDDAFSGCDNLTKIKLPDSLEGIGCRAFSYCYSLNSINIPSSVTRIGNNAFEYCSIDSVYIDNLASWCHISFGNEKANPLSKYLYLDNDVIEDLLVPDSVTVIGDYSFYGCKYLNKVTIPSTVTTIGKYAFSDCSNLRSINQLGNSLIIKENAFRNCSNLTTINIFNSEIYIGDYAFYGCTGLNIINIPETVKSIGDYAFSGCSNLKHITVAKNNTAYDSRNNCNAIIETASNSLIVGCKNTVIPNSVVSIGKTAFYRCGLINITIPNSIKSIGYNSFDFHDNDAIIISEIYRPFDIPREAMTSWRNIILYVPIGTTVKYKATTGWNSTNIIEYTSDNDIVLKENTKEGVEISYQLIDKRERTCQMSANQSVLQSYNGQVVTIPNTVKGFTVTGISDKAFANCSSLRTILFPESITTVGNNLFEGCNNLSAIYWNAERTVPTTLLESITNPNLLLYVKSDEYAPVGYTNVVVNDKAKEIILSDAASGNNFYCPQEFTAERISYVHNYSMQSGYNECRGWETIVLPFDVTLITNQAGAELVPRSAWTVGSSQRPFFLYGLTDGEWQPATSIKANTPYIISMPNNDHYSSDYCLTGDVEFRGVNVKVHPSDQLAPAAYGQRKLIPTYTNLEASQDIFALNVNNLWSTYGGTEFAEGSTFIRNMRSVHPFEAYMTMEGSAARAIPIFDDADITGIGDAIRLNDKDEKDDTRVYNLAGQQVQTPVKGLYIINGKKVIK